MKLPTLMIHNIVVTGLHFEKGGLDHGMIFVQGQVSRVVPQVPWNGKIPIKVLLILSMMIQNHDVGAGDKKGDMEYVISLDKIMVTEFQDFLVVCFTLGMPGIYGKYKG